MGDAVGHPSHGTANGTHFPWAYTHGLPHRVYHGLCHGTSLCHCPMSYRMGDATGQSMAYPMAFPCGMYAMGFPMGRYMGLPIDTVHEVTRGLHEIAHGRPWAHPWTFVLCKHVILYPIYGMCTMLWASHETLHGHSHWHVS